MTGWYIGAIVNVVGSILINLGTNVMKLGHNKRSADLPESSRRPIRKYREWQCGVSLFAVGNALNFVSFGFAAQSLLAALGSIQFVSNVFFAWFVLHERADRRVIVATAMIVVGCIVLVAFGNHQSKPMNSRQLQHLFQNDIYIAYLSWLLATAGLAYIVYQIGTQKLKREGLGGMSHRWMKALPISYSLFSGMIGTQSVLFSKALSTLMRTTIDGHSQLGTWFFWLVLVLFLCCAYFWVTSLNKALRLFPAVVIVPTMQISWTLFSVVSGGIYYQEYHAFTAFTASMFGLGILIVFSVAYFVQSKGQQWASFYLISVARLMFHQEGFRLRTLAVDLWSSSPLSLLTTLPADATADRRLPGSVEQTEETPPFPQIHQESRAEL
ncbi:hypothetical protein WJX82_009682 [Trebouxia sp. C0006]